MSQLIRSNSVRYKTSISEVTESDVPANDQNESKGDSTLLGAFASPKTASDANVKLSPETQRETVEAQIQKARDEAFQQGLKQGIDESKDKFLRQGYEKGFEEGVAAGKKELQEQQADKVSELSVQSKKLTDKLEILKTLLLELEALTNNAPKLVENSAVEIAFAAVNRFLVSKATDKELIGQIVQKCVQKTWNENIARIKVSIADNAIIEQLVKENQFESHIQKLNFEVDPQLNSGDCIVETQSGELRSILTEQLNTLVEQLITVNSK